MSVGLTDEELIARYRSHESVAVRQECINELFRRHLRKVSLWCLRITEHREAAADLAQEIFLKAFEKLDSYQGSSKFTTWIYSITRNHCLNYLKSSSRKMIAVEDSVLLGYADRDAGEVFKEIESAGSRRELMQLVSRTLDATELKVMTLHFGEGVPLEGVSRLLRLSNRSGAKAYIVSAKRKLAKSLRRWKAKQGGAHQGTY